MEAGVGRGRGKLVLCGEHAVVYGYPALAFGLDRGTSVRATRIDGPTSVSSPHADARLAAALRSAVAAEGWRLEVETDLPVGRGMGSSAALAVALVRALAGAAGEVVSDERTFEAAMPVEQEFHGNASGLDVALAVRGGMVRYTRGPPPTIEPLPLPGWTAVALDSGEAGDTRALVASVAARRPRIDAVLERIGGMADRARPVLDDPRALGRLVDENHELLCQIGVSTPGLDALVGWARRHGATGAKLAGAGGGGVVLAISEDPAHLLAMAARDGLTAWACRPSPRSG